MIDSLRFSGVSRFALALALPALSLATPLRAQSADAPARATLDQPEPSTAGADPAPDPVAPDGESDDLVTDIVVNAPRLVGSAQTDIPADVELDEAAIASYGASDVTELLAALAPQTTSNRGRGSGGPVVLVNGRRVSGFGEIRNIPPEAIQKVEVFPEEVALEYGYSADQRVVNFILKPNFRSLAVSAEGGLATQGGRGTHELEASFLNIGSLGRLNLTAEWEASTRLNEAERDLIQSTRPTSAAGLSIIETGAALDLTGAQRDLQGNSDKIELDATLARPLGDADLSITANAERTDTNRRLGQTSTRLNLPATHPQAPGGMAALVAVTLPDPLVRESRSDVLSVGSALNGRIDRWRWTATGNFTRSENDTTTTISPGVTEIAAAQAIIDAGGNPFADRLFGTLMPGAPDRSRSLNQSLTGNMNAAGTLIDGWAGPIRSTFNVGFAMIDQDSRATRRGVVSAADLGRDTVSARTNLVVPLLDPEYDGPAAVGRLSLNANLSLDELSDFGSLVSWGAGVDWATPLEGLTAIISTARDEVAPGISDLGAPVVINPGVTTYDFRRGETVLVDTVSGGNPALLSERRRDWKAGLTYSPPTLRELSLSVNWNRNRSYDVTSNFPLLTDEIEAAFPDRVTRDASGRLVRIDMRPVTYARTAAEQLRWGVNFGKSFGEASGGDAPAGRGPRAGGPRGGGGGPRAGGPRGGGGGRFGPPGGRAGRWQVSLYHTVKFDDRILIRPGVAELDLLDGSATGGGGGSTRHAVELDGGWFYKGFGLRGSANYTSGSDVDGSATSSALRFGDLATFTLRAFMDFNQRPKLIEAVPFLKGSRMRLSVANLFDAQRRVTDATGAVPLRFQPGYIDPVGRTVEVEFRKLF